MSDKEILEKTIQKAIDNGWKALPLGGKNHWNNTKDKSSFTENMIVMGSSVQSESYRVIIYNHDFAKALWNDRRADYVQADYYSSIDNSLSGSYWLPLWHYHLQQMVIADDPIKYLGENI